MDLFWQQKHVIFALTCLVTTRQIYSLKYHLVKLGLDQPEASILDEDVEPPAEVSTANNEWLEFHRFLESTLIIPKPHALDTATSDKFGDQLNMTFEDVRTQLALFVN